MLHGRLSLLAGPLLGCVAMGAYVYPLDGPIARVLRNISEESLRGNLSFLSSDVLAGRWTPSSGLDVAAEFIASRFRAAGVKPGNGESYFQGATLRANPPVAARNVIAILPGSDPRLRDTYVIVSAHYDHIGTLNTGKRLTRDKMPIMGDAIFNGANDDGSGTVSVIEIASAFKKAGYRPRRTIVFLLFCGEELGELGSEYYTKHPIFPLSRTVADINLEQLGRSDSDFGKGRASLTGYGYTTLTALFEGEAKDSGFTLVRTKASDTYFEDSDNYSFARVGVPDLTFATSFNFPDYHGLKDECTKIDFADLARADRLVTRVIAKVANDRNSPQWQPDNPQTAKYRQAEAARKAAEGTATK
jgi:Zn-dependent M28 family amino/carboxypeptidase